MTSSLVGSEMCIRDRQGRAANNKVKTSVPVTANKGLRSDSMGAVGGHRGKGMPQQKVDKQGTVRRGLHFCV
eukprot:7274890-Prorocentrum_lima.AAC.1